ncbi:hypothetical protein [uncultured Brevundimonas sp.]|uniref:hypothetical protein n=1 Tax=uncultured Brevundimonas sp. TaxID=213418 RepID=UPI0025D663D2|nr:hypothetical protein [uncultured Brevundimonas sp.]
MPADVLKPTLQDLGDDRIALVTIAIRHCLMPHPDVVSAFPYAVFPSVRDARRRGHVEDCGGQAVMFDDNTTPRWALLWSHGIKSLPRAHGWTFAHVWDRSTAALHPHHAYTHLANLCMMPEFFGSLSDKKGPLVGYLQYHAWNRYGWSPDMAPPAKPTDFDELEWRYLDPALDPQSAFRSIFLASRDKRAIELRRLMSVS